MDMVVLSVLVVAVTGLVLGVCIAVAAKKFAVEVDPRIDEVAALLPGANCGGCGFAGCADLAKNIVEGKAPVNKCPACPAANIEKIAECLGQKVEASEKKVAVVLCSGTLSHSKMGAQYNGILDCRSAVQLNGAGKDCRFGCIGFGTCAHVCKFGAIEVIDGLAVVHPELCVGCGQCAEACPRKLIKLVPASARMHIYCNSLEKPALRMKKCTASCIACRKCLKAAPDKFNPQGFMIRAVYTNPPDESVIEAAKCPRKCLLTPEQHLEAVREDAKKKEGAA